MRKLVLATLCIFVFSSSVVAKDWEAVLAILEQGPQSPAIIKKRAQACSNLAVEAYQNKKPNEAAKWLKKAAELDPTGGHQNRLIEILRKENKSALDKEAKKREEQQIEASFSKATDTYFDVRFQNTVDPKTDSGLRVGMMTARNLIAKDFKFTPRKKSVVLIYSSAEFPNSHNGRHCSHHASDENIRLALDDTGNLRSAIATFFHEYTHAAIDELGRGQCPTWLNEGLSQVQEYKIQRKPLTALQEATKNESILSFQELDAAIESDDPQQYTLGYQQSYSLASFLNEVFGPSKIRQLLKVLGRGKSFEIALKTSCGISKEQFVAGWKAWYPTKLN